MSEVTDTGDGTSFKVTELNGAETDASSGEGVAQRDGELPDAETDASGEGVAQSDGELVDPGTGTSGDGTSSVDDDRQSNGNPSGEVSGSINGPNAHATGASFALHRGDAQCILDAHKSRRTAAGAVDLSEVYRSSGDSQRILEAFKGPSASQAAHASDNEPQTSRTPAAAVTRSSRNIQSPVMAETVSAGSLKVRGTSEKDISEGSGRCEGLVTSTSAMSGDAQRILRASTESRPSGRQSPPGASSNTPASDGTATSSSSCSRSLSGDARRILEASRARGVPASSELSNGGMPASSIQSGGGSVPLRSNTDDSANPTDSERTLSACKDDDRARGGVDGSRGDGARPPFRVAHYDLSSDESVSRA